MLARSELGTYITQIIAGDVSQLRSRLVPVNHALVHQTRHEHALTICSARIHTSNHLISDERRERVSLVIELIERVLPKHVEDGGTDEKSTDSHP